MENTIDKSQELHCFKMKPYEARVLKYTIDTWWQMHRVGRLNGLKRKFAWFYVSFKWNVLARITIYFATNVEEPIEYYIKNRKNITTVKKLNTDDKSVVEICFI